MGSFVHRLSQSGKLLVDFKSAAILVAQGPMLRNAVPRVVGEIVGERELRRRIEFLARDL